MAELKLSSKYFSVSGLYSGYHQIKITKKDEQLFVFLLRRDYMCMADSSHKFVNSLNILLNDLPSKIEVDSYIAEGDN